MDGFEKSVDLVHRYLDVLSLRQSVIADNIANVDTPNFKRSKVSFEAELERAILNEKSSNLSLVKSNNKHLDGFKELNYLDVKPRRILDYLSTLSNNGNNIDIDSEMKSLFQNQMIYGLFTNIQAHHFKSVNIVIK
ncbi:flagellar basal body rod protein FlgB [Borrelia miyamotoi]|uniref:Flagellar basal body rod protein FlgB n=1 Tax=Borrelia miyamotoi TaxID=47466 RepID=A0AAQ3AH48_9SPIR|nr:flagellar basal body rod protein FlgB [Borrelia miyamotoi]AGT27291.1 flagellar basal body rod protein FlgB [Borrelia miyamotoi LB-2001]AJA58474.1 flagellar basal body rod protein FlgB [Borrelia miyamotoi]AOW95552.1 flagellar basal-body rod protein FlgB [Borrelia miyamotoi]QTL83436.1 flagellar basal body rod protein FlgB [Borrelia miyamotoi]WAZ85270.1 flagellar basal body rod protein FlgB [Borrelia miyamotoi]